MLDKDFDTTGMTKDQLRDAVMLLESVESASGRTAKSTLLSGGSGNPVFLLFIKLTFGQQVFNITIDPDSVSEVVAADIISVFDSFTSFVSMAKQLSTRELAGGAASVQAARLLHCCHPKLRKWLIRILNRDLRIGVGKKTIESLFVDILTDASSDGAPTYRGCMTAKKLYDVYDSMSELSFPLAAELKLDGERSNNFVYPSVGKIFVFTRGGKRKLEIEAVQPYVDQLLEFTDRLLTVADLPLDTPIYLDGEFLAKDWNSTASIINRSKNFNTQMFVDNIRVMLWDWAPVSNYAAGAFAMPWQERKRLLQAAAGVPENHPKAHKVSSLVYVLGHRIISNESVLQMFYDASVDNNFEGLMLKQLDSPHVFTRNHKFMFKLKPFDTMTGTIVDLVAGSGKHAAATADECTTAKVAMSKFGTVTKDAVYYHVAVESSDQAQIILDKLRSVIYDDVDRRFSTHLPGFVSYRHAARLGYFVVNCDGKQFHVGGGIGHKAGADYRTDFLQRRSELIGTKLDFRSQRTDTADAVARFNSFVRLREDL